jgi:hypothetical protein
MRLVLVTINQHAQLVTLGMDMEAIAIGQTNDPVFAAENDYLFVPDENMHPDDFENWDEDSPFIDNPDVIAEIEFQAWLDSAGEEILNTPITPRDELAALLSAYERAKARYCEAQEDNCGDAYDLQQIEDAEQMIWETKHTLDTRFPIHTCEEELVWDADFNCWTP